LNSMLTGLLHDVAVARLTFVELIFLSVVDADAELVTDVIFLIDVLILEDQEDAFRVEVVTFCKDDIDTFRKPVT
jgi:hypothetical protein